MGAHPGLGVAKRVETAGSAVEATEPVSKMPMLLRAPRRGDQKARVVALRRRRSRPRRHGAKRWTIAQRADLSPPRGTRAGSRSYHVDDPGLQHDGHRTAEALGMCRSRLRWRRFAAHQQVVLQARDRALGLACTALCGLVERVLEEAGSVVIGAGVGSAGDAYRQVTSSPCRSKVISAAPATPIAPGPRAEPRSAVAPRLVRHERRFPNLPQTSGVCRETRRSG